MVTIYYMCYYTIYYIYITLATSNLSCNFMSHNCDVNYNLN